MKKKIGLNVGGRKFDVDVDEKFSKFLEEQMEKDFRLEGNNEVKVLLHAYVRKNHELYMQEMKIEEILNKLDA